MSRELWKIVSKKEGRKCRILFRFNSFLIIFVFAQNSFFTPSQLCASRKSILFHRRNFSSNFDGWNAFEIRNRRQLGCLYVGFQFWPSIRGSFGICVSRRCPSLVSKAELLKGSQYSWTVQGLIKKKKKWNHGTESKFMCFNFQHMTLHPF